MGALMHGWSDLLPSHLKMGKTNDISLERVVKCLDYFLFAVH